VATPAIRKEGEAPIDEQNKQTKQTEPKIKGNKYAKNKKEYRVLPWDMG
jgi:hypothetical protein